MKKGVRKKIIGWGVFYLCFILVGLVVVGAMGNGPEQVVSAADTANSSKSEQAVEAADVAEAAGVDESGMLYLNADAYGKLTKEDADEETPVSVKVTYYLDNKEMTADSIAGKTGKVKLRFDYENLMTKTVKIGGKDLEVQVPFMVLSAVVLPSDIFSNVEISSGKVMTEEDQNIAIGTAFPGLKTSLNLKDVEDEMEKDIDIPDYVEITADAQDFELDFTATIIASMGLDEMDTEGLDDVDDLIKSMRELSDASAKLVEGTGTLFSGMQAYQTAITSYTDGTEQLQSGIQEINKAVAAYTTSGNEGTREVMAAAQALAVDAQVLAGMAGQLGTLQANVESVKSAIAEAKVAIGAADQNAIAQAERYVEAAREQVNNTAYNSEDEKVAALAALDAIDFSGISGVTGDANGQLEQAQASLDGLTIDTDTIMAALSDMQSQLNILSGFSQNMTGLSDGLAQLSTSLGALQSGADELTAYNTQLLEGIKSLTEGTGSLKEGITTFDKDGIQELKNLTDNELQNLTNRIKALKEAERQYRKEHAGADGEVKSYVIETEEIRL